MVVVSWAGFGNQATTWGGGGTNNEGAPRKARVTPRRLCQVALRANQQQASQLEMCTLTYIRALDNAPAWRMRAAH